MRFLYIILLLSVFACGWELKGSSGTAQITNLDNNILWVYRSGTWYECCYDSEIKTKILYGGEGYWLQKPYSLIPTTKSIKNSWQEGWNLVTPVFDDWDMSEKFRGDVLVGWKYKNGKWLLYGNYDYPQKFNSVKMGEGVWVYIPKIDIKIDNLPLFCKDGSCSKIINSAMDYKIAFKIDKDEENNEVKFAFDLLRYYNNTHYRLALGPFTPTNLDTNISVCVQKVGSADTGSIINNKQKKILQYKSGYIIIDSQKIAAVFQRNIPQYKEKFLMKIYVEGIHLKGFKKDKAFGELGPEVEGIAHVELTNANESASFEMEIR